jgi:hypothetical protein
MADLRDLVIEAHGGHKRWKRFRTIEGEMSITGKCSGSEKAGPMYSGAFA